MIRSTKHRLHPANCGKRSKLAEFREEYERVCLGIIDQIWDNGYGDFNVADGKLSLPQRLDYKDFAVETNLSARALQCCANQAGGIIRSAVEKQRRVTWVNENFGKMLPEKKFSKPRLDFIHPQLNANCCDIRIEDGGFGGFAELKSLGKGFGKIRLPIEKHKMFSKWKAKGSIRQHVTLCKHSFHIAWSVECGQKPQGNEVVGIDQGYTTVASLSNGTRTPEFCPHGHSSVKIHERLARKTKGSKSFARTQAHRKNFINWSINQLNFEGIKEVRLEKVTNIRFKKRSSRKLSHWSNPLVRDKIIARCEELEVPVIEQSCAYRSQRCHKCGNVRKANRKGKEYRCKHCGNVCDADLNAACNHSVNLPPIPNAIRERRLNLGDGFFWKPNGVFALDGTEP